MKPIYVPISKAKKGEFDAYAHLSESTINRIIPWFDVPRLSDKTRKEFEDNSKPTRLPTTHTKRR